MWFPRSPGTLSTAPCPTRSRSTSLATAPPARPSRAPPGRRSRSSGSVTSRGGCTLTSGIGRHHRWLADSGPDFTRSITRPPAPRRSRRTAPPRHRLVLLGLEGRCQGRQRPDRARSELRRLPSTRARPTRRASRRPCSTRRTTRMAASCTGAFRRPTPTALRERGRPRSHWCSPPSSWRSQHVVDAAPDDRDRHRHRKGRRRARRAWGENRRDQSRHREDDQDLRVDRQGLVQGAPDEGRKDHFTVSKSGDAGTKAQVVVF